MLLRAWLSLAGAAIILASCGSSGPSPDRGGTDATDGETAPDVSGSDGGSDASGDLPAGDAAVDVSPDGGADALLDASADTPADASGDAPGDVSGGDGPADGNSDRASSDAGVDGGSGGGPCGVLGWGLNTMAAIAPGGASVALATPDGHLELRRWSDATVLPGIDNGFFGANAVVYSRDGALLAAATSDGVKIWRVSDATLVVSIAALANATAVGLSDDGHVVAAILPGQLVVSRPAGLLTIPLSRASAVAVSPDGALVAATYETSTPSPLQSGHNDAAWRVSDGQRAWSAPYSSWGSDPAAAHVVFSRDGTMVAFGRSVANPTVGAVRRPADGSAITTIGSDLMAFSDDGQALLGVAADGGYQIIRVSDGGTARAFMPGLGSKVIAAGFGAGLTALAVVQPSLTGSGADNLQLMTDAAQTGTVRRISWQYSLGSVAIAPDGSLLVAGGFLWNTRSGTLVGPGGIRGQVAFSPDSTRLAICDGDRVSVGIVQPTTAAAFTLVTAASSVVFAPDGTLIATGNTDGTASVWNASTGALVRTLWNLNSGASGITGVAFSPDATLVVTAASGALHIWRVSDGNEVRTINVLRNVDSVRFSPDGAWLIAAVESDGVKIWDVASGALVRSLSGISDAVATLGSGLLFMATDTGIGRFSLPDLTDLGLVPSSGNGGFIRSVDVTADGAMVASTANSAVVRLWCLR